MKKYFYKFQDLVECLDLLDHPDHSWDPDIILHQVLLEKMIMVGGAVEACHLPHHQEWSPEESPLHQIEEVMEATVAMEVMVIMVDMEVMEAMVDIGICLHLDTTCHHRLVRRHQDNGVVDMASPLPHPGHQVPLDPQVCYTLQHIG